jgi:ATP-binding cassette subfamily B protein
VKHLWRILAYMKPYRAYIAVGLVCLAVTDGMQLITPWIIRHAINDLISKTATGERLFLYGLTIMVLAVFVGFFRFLWRQTIIRSSFRLEQVLRDDLFRHLGTLSMSYYDTTKTGDLMARTTNDMRNVQRTAGIGFVLIADILIMGVASVCFMFFLNLELTLIALTPMVLITLLIMVLDRALKRRFRAVQECFSDLTERVRENLSGVRVVKAFVQEEAEIRDFSHISQEYMDKNMALVRLWGLFFPMIMFFGGLGTVIVLLFGGRSVMTASISLGDYVAFAAYLGMLMWPMMAIGWVVNLLQRGTVSMGRVGEILDTEPAIRDREDPVEPDAVAGAVSFRKLTFAYNGKPVLRDVDVTVPAGQTVGVVGGIGAGKSSLIHLLTRLYDPPPGTVFLDDVDIRDLSLRNLRRHVVSVPQEPFLFTGTLAENIAFGRPDATAEEIRDAADSACIHDAIAGFPKAYDEVVGERGVTLSGGEKQRVSIARALISDAPVVIFDDSLSAVDTETEAAILERLRRSTQNRTTLIISHRISAVEKADQIIVLEGGRVTEQGTHEELVRNGGWYFRMYKRQQVQMKLGLEAGEDLKARPPSPGEEDEEPGGGFGGHGDAWTDR